MILLLGLLHGNGPPRPIPFRLIICVLHLDLLDSDCLLDGSIQKNGKALEKGLIPLVKDDQALYFALRFSREVSERAVKRVSRPLIINAASVTLHLEAVWLKNWVLNYKVAACSLLSQILRLRHVQVESWVCQQNLSALSRRDEIHYQLTGRF